MNGYRSAGGHQRDETATRPARAFFRSPHRSVGSIRQKLFAVVVVALFASVLVVAGPAGITTDVAQAQVAGDPIDCESPAEDVMVITTGEVVTPGMLQAAPRIAFQPGRYDIVEDLLLNQLVEITSCDPLNPAVLANGGNLTYTLRLRADRAQPQTAHIHDINFDVLQFNGIVATGAVDLVVERVNIVADGRVLPSGSISSVIVTDGATAVLRDVAITGPHRGVSAPRSGDIEMERVTITDTLEFGVFIEGDSQDPNGFRPDVTIQDSTIRGVSLPGSRGLSIGSGTFTVTNSTIACASVNLDLRPSVAQPAASTFALGDTTIGETTCAIEQQVGLRATAETPFSMVRGLVSGSNVGVLFEGSSGIKTFLETKIAGNAVGIDSDQPVEFSQVTMSENGRDCQVTAGLITSDIGAYDGTCLANPGPTGVDCAVPPADAAVIQPGDDLLAPLQAGGLVLLESGRHEVAIDLATLNADVELTSCDVSNPATLVRVSRCQRTLALEGPPGISAYVHDVNIEGGSAGLTARGGMQLVAEEIQIAGIEPFCDGDDRGLEISGGSTGIVERVNISNFPWGVRVRETGDVTFTDVIVDGNRDYGIHIASANQPAALRPRITLTRTTVTNTSRSGSTGHGVLAISADLIIDDSTISCNQNTNVRATTWDVATDIVDLRVVGSLVGRLNVETKCTGVVQADGVSTSGLVHVATARNQIFDHDTALRHDGKSGEFADVFETTIENNSLGIATSESLRLRGTSFIGNGNDCEAAPGQIEDQGGNGPIDGTCFEPAFTLAPATTNNGFSTTDVNGREVFRIERPIGVPGFPDAATFSEFVITSAEPAPPGGLFVQWTLAGSTFAGLPTADRADIVIEEIPAGKRQLPPAPLLRRGSVTPLGWLAQVTQLPDDFVSSPQSVVIPAGETTATVRVVPRVDLDPGEAIEIGLINHSATLQAVISPTDFDFDVVTPAEPLLIGAGDTGTVEVQMTPALPEFALRDALAVDWAVTGPGADALVEETSGIVTFTAEANTAATSTATVDITALPSIDQSTGLRFELENGDGLDFEVTEAVEAPLRVVSMTPLDGDEFVLPAGGPDAGETVLELNPGVDDQGVLIVLNRPVDVATTVSVDVVGVQVGLAGPIDDPLEVSSVIAIVEAGSDRVEAAVSARVDRELEPVEGFRLIATLPGQEADAPRLDGFISPDSYRVDFRGPDHPAGTELDEGDSLDITVIVTPADPYSEGLVVPWQVIQPSFVDELLDATDDDFVGSDRDIDFVFSAAAGDTAASMTRTLTVEAVDGDGTEGNQGDEFETYTIGVASDPSGFYVRGDVAEGLINDTDVAEPLRVVDIIASEETTIENDGEAIEVFELIPGQTDEFIEVVLNRPVTAADIAAAAPPVVDGPAAVRLNVTVVGIDVGLTVPVDVAADFTTRPLEPVIVPEGADRVRVPYQAASDRNREPVEGFLIEASVHVAPADPVEAVSMFGFIPPDSYLVDFLGPDHPDDTDVDEGDSFEITVVVTPADPYSEGFVVPWIVTEDDFFDEPDATDADFVGSDREVDFVFSAAAGDSAASMTRTFSVEVAENDGDEIDRERYLIAFDPDPSGFYTGANDVSGHINDTDVVEPLRVVSMTPLAGDEFVLPAGGPDAGETVLKLNPGEDHGALIVLNRPVTEATFVSVTLVGAQVGVAEAIDDALEVFPGVAIVEPGSDRVEVSVSARVDRAGEQVEGFRLIASVGDQGADAPRLDGFVSPDSFEVDFINEGFPGLDEVSEGEVIAIDVTIRPASPYSEVVVPWRVFTFSEFFDASDADFVTTSRDVTLVPGPNENATSMTTELLVEVGADDGAERQEEFEIVLDSARDLDGRFTMVERAQGLINDTDTPELRLDPAPDDAILIVADDGLQIIPGRASSFSIVRSSPATEDITFNWEIQGSTAGSLPSTEAADFVAAAGLATIVAGSDSVTVEVEATPDSVGTETAEAFEIRVADTELSLLGVIQPEFVVLTVAPVDALGAVARGSEAEGLVVDVTMTPAYAFSTGIDVDWVVSGDSTFGDRPADAADFGASDGDLSFAYNPAEDTAERATRRLQIAVANDSQAEPEEGFKLVLSSVGDADAVVLGYLVGSPAGSPGDAPDPDDDTVPFGGFRVADPQGEVRETPDGTQGDVGGRFRLPEWPDDLPITIAIRDGRATVTYDDTFDDVELGEPPFLRIINPRVVATAAAGLDGSMEAQITITADRAEFFPESDGGPIAVATNLVGVARSDGSITFTTDDVTGTFADLEVVLNDVALVVTDNPSIPLLSVGDVETVDGVEVAGIRVFRDGRIVVAELCVTEDADLAGRVGIAGLGFTLEEACLRTADNGTQTFDVTGIFDAELNVAGVGDIVSGVSVGADPDNEGRASFVLIDDGDGFTPETLGPINVRIGEFEVAGLTVEGEAEVAGWQNGLLDPAVSGELNISGENLLLDNTDLTATVNGSVTTQGSTTTLDLGATVAGDLSLADGLVVITEGELGLEISIESTTTESAGVASTDVTVDGPSLSALDLAATVTIPGLNDVDDDPVQVDATVTYDEGDEIEGDETWTITVEPTLASGWDFGIWSLNEISGELVLRPNAPVGERIDGEFALLANVTTDTDDVVTRLDLEVSDTTTPGEFALSVDSNTTWSGSGIPGLVVVNGELDIDGSARVNLADPAFALGAFAAVGSFDRATLALGDFLVDLEGATVSFDGDPATPLLEITGATASIADPDDPEEDLITLTIANLTIADDGSIAVGEVDVDNIDNLTDSFGLNGILPFTLERLVASFSEPGNFDTFSLRAVGEVDLGGIDDLDLRVAQGVGSVATCEGDPGSLVIPFDFTLAIESLSEGQIRPQNLESLSVAVCDVELAGFVGSAQIQLGGYRNGQLVPEVSGSISIESAEDTDSPLTGGVGITIGGRVIDNGDGATLLIDGRAAVSGAFDNAIVVEDAAFDFGFDVAYAESTGALSIQNARAGNGTVGLLRLAVDDVITFEAENVSIYPQPNVLASFIGGSVAVSFGADLDVLDGWGGSAGNFSVVTTDDGGLDVIVEPSFFVTITAPDDVDIGLPDWLPFTLTEAGLQWPVVSEPTSLFTLLEDIATAHVLISGGLVGSESGWPFDAQVDGLVIDLGILGDWLGGDFSQSPIVDLEGVLIGIAPRDWGPARVGGGLALGYVPGDNGEPVWYGRLFGEFAVDGFGLGLDMVVSEHGPIAASFQSPAAIPLDPSGLMLSGVSGGLDFSLGGRIPALPAPDCESVDGGLVCPDGSSPLSLLTSSAYNFDTPRTWSLAQIQQAVREQQARGGSWLPDVVTMYIGGDITHAVTAGAISGQVRLAATLDATTDAAGLVLLGTGNVSVWGLGGGDDPGGLARAGLLLDLSDPINPQFTIAAEVPNGDDWLAAALPGQAQFGMTLDTEGLAQGLALALQTFLTESVGNPAFDGLFFDYAQMLNANRSLRVAELLAIDPSTEITSALLRAELQALVSGGSDAPLAAQAVVADLLTLASNPLGAVAGPLADQPLIISTDERPAPATAQAVLDALLDAAQQAAIELVEVADPKLLAEGQTQLRLLGIPFGSPQGARLFFSKEQFFFEAQGSVTDTIRSACFVPGCAEVLYLLSAGVTDTTTLGFGIPINPQSLIDGTAFASFDPFTSPWRATVGGSLTMFGFPLANANGVMLGGGQPDAVDQELDSGRYTIAVPPGARSAMEEFGGLLVEANLQLPGFLTDPGERLAELGNADCFEFPGELGDIPGWFGRCVDETTAADTVGAVQLFAPLPPFPGTCEANASTCPEWAVDQMYARGEFDGSILGLPLGNASIEANASGLTVTARPPLVPDSSTTEWNFAIGSREIDDGNGGTNTLPTVGLEAGLTSDDLTLLLREFGLDELLDLSAVDADISVRAYTPGYDPDGDTLQQQGGIEIEAMASIDNIVEEVAFSFSLTPRASLGQGDLLAFNVSATATVTNATIAGIEVDSGLISISVIDEVVSVVLEIDGSVGEFDVTGELLGTVSSSGLSGSFAGQVTLPAGLSGANRASLAATGSLRTNGDFTLTVEADEIELGPLAIDGSLSLRRRSNTITFEIGRSRVELEGPDGSVLVSGRTNGISVSSDGQLEGDITFNRIGSADFIALEGLTVRLVADFSSDDSAGDGDRRSRGLLAGGFAGAFPLENDDDIVFDLAIQSGDVVLGFLSGANGADAPRLSGPDLRLLIQRDGDFSLSTEIEPLDLGILQLDRSTAALTFEEGVLTFEADFGASVPIGDNRPSRVSVQDLSINSLGQVTGDLSGNLSLFDSRLASVSATLSSPPGKPGVIRIGDIDAQLGGGSFRAFMGRFTGHFDTDGTVDLTASLDVDFDMSIGPIPIAAVEGTGSVRVTNSGAVASITDGTVSVFLFSCSGIEVELGVYVNPVGLAGSASLCDRFLQAEFAWPAGFEPPTTSPEPTWIYLPTSVDLGVVSLTQNVTLDYDLPIARNGTVECSPAPGTQLAIVVGSLTASCTATSPSGQQISGEFELAVSELPALTTGPQIGGSLDGLTVGGVSLDDEPDAVVTASPSIFIQLQDDQPKKITTTSTSKGEAIEAKPGDEFAGLTKVLPGTVVTGKLRSEPLEVFSVIADADGNAEWRFAIPDDFSAGEHSLIITGIGVDAQSFASIVPLFIEDDVVQVFDPILPSPSGAADGGLETAADFAGAASGSSADAPAQATTDSPLAHTGFAGRRLAMLGLWLVLIGSFTMGTRRSLSGRATSRGH